MTNKEFYSDKLFAALIGVSSCQLMHYYVFGENCTGNNCKDCRFSSIENIENWLNANHEEPEPPLLENGDGMKLGDWIMVRNHEDHDWVKRLFVYHKDGLFWTLDVGFFDKIKIECWIQAHLPMENK